MYVLVDAALLCHGQSYKFFTTDRELSSSLINKIYQDRNYDGMHLLKHALHNTCPDMMKSVGKDEHGNDIQGGTMILPR